MPLQIEASSPLIPTASFISWHRYLMAIREDLELHPVHWNTTILLRPWANRLSHISTSVGAEIESPLITLVAFPSCPHATARYEADQEK